MKQDVTKLLPEALASETVQEEVDRGIDNDSQFGHGERLIDDPSITLGLFQHEEALSDALECDQDQEGEGHGQKDARDLAL